jgi:hypothetical protein
MKVCDKLVFVFGWLFRPGKTIAYPRVNTLKVGCDLINKDYTKLERPARDENSSLLRTFLI